MRPCHRPSRWLQMGFVVTSLAGASAWAVDANERTPLACGGVTSHLHETGSGCAEAQFHRLDARLQDLLVQRERLSTSDAARATGRAEHVRWQRVAMAFCAGVAATEPMPTYAAALLDCAASILKDRVATLEDQQRSNAALREQPRASALPPQPD